LADLFERIGARTAGGCTAEADARSQRLHHRAIEAVGDGLYTDVLRVRGLHLILLERLHLDEMPAWGTSTVLVAGNIFGHFLITRPR
jgi:hypothetical protein